MKSKKHLDLSRDQSCINCGAADGTVVAAHYQGMRQHAFGKGVGIKPSDLCVADLCSKCHNAFDTSTIAVDPNSTDKFTKKIDRSEQFLYLILKTLIRRERQGLLHVGIQK